MTYLPAPTSSALSSASILPMDSTAPSGINLEELQKKIDNVKLAYQSCKDILSNIVNKSLDGDTYQRIKCNFDDDVDKFVGASGDPTINYAQNLVNALVSYQNYIQNHQSQLRVYASIGETVQDNNNINYESLLHPSNTINSINELLGFRVIGTEVRGNTAGGRPERAPPNIPKKLKEFDFSSLQRYLDQFSNLDASTLIGGMSSQGYGIENQN